MISADTADFPTPSSDDGFEIRGTTTEAEEPERPRRKRSKRGKRRAAPREDEAIVTAMEDSRERLLVVAHNVAAEVRKRPVAMILASVGVGFVLGGALSMRTGRAALAALGRFAMRRLMTGT